MTASQTPGAERPGGALPAAGTADRTPPGTVGHGPPAGQGLEPAGGSQTELGDPMSGEGVGSPSSPPNVVGIDLSLVSTGLGFSRGADVWRLQPPKGMTGLDRLNWIRGRIAESCARAHLAVMEGPSYASEGKYSHERAGLWWLVLDTLVTDYKVPVAIVPPAVLKRYATGKGNASKDAVLAAVIRRYPGVPVTGNDQADAWTLCAMGLRHLGHPAEESLPKPNLAAMVKVDWPEVGRG